MTAKVSDLLHATGDLLEQPGVWIQNHFAEDASGEIVGPLSEYGVKWCLDGALLHCANLLNYGLYGDARDFIDEAADAKMHLARWNDCSTRTQAEVVAVLRKAEQLAKDVGK